MYSFLTACSLGYYGDDCNSECGKCAGNDGCDSHSGDCAGECLGNWQKPKCNGKEPQVYQCRAIYVLFPCRVKGKT